MLLAVTYFQVTFVENGNAIVLKRDCPAIMIPSGEKVTLPSGTEVEITQSLGGTFTVTTDQGMMVRIAGKDADALGKAAPEESKASQKSDKPVGELVWDQLRTCYDPEIAANIVDLGLIYDCSVSSVGNNQHKVEIKMTLTAPGCGMGASIAADAKYKVEHVPGVKEVKVDLVWDPPWNPTMMSEEAKHKLGLI